VAVDGKGADVVISKHELLGLFNRAIRRTGFTVLRARHSITLTDPPSFRLEPRWVGERGHPQLADRIERGDERYRETLRTMEALGPRLRSIPIARDASTDPRSPVWHNGIFPALDAAALFMFVATTRPRRYIEIGSGNSTQFARRAIEASGAATHVTSIDPEPRREIDALCDRVIRRPLEETPLEIFGELEAGDILFFDGSHRSFMNSDVTIFFLDILPRLPPGVLVQIHDIYLPSDYIPRIGLDHWYNEQYLLGAYLLGDARGERVEIVLPNYWITWQQRFAADRARLWDAIGLPWRNGEFPETHLGGGSFWLRTLR
jgi:hypothetical protein